MLKNIPLFINAETATKLSIAVWITVLLHKVVKGVKLIMIKRPKIGIFDKNKFIPIEKVLNKMSKIIYASLVNQNGHDEIN